MLNRLTQLNDSASLAFTFAYDATNKLTTRTSPNGTTLTEQYDGLDRLTGLKYMQGTTTLADYQYQFNAVNNISQMTDDAGANNYSYDSVDRLTAATHPNQPNENYSHDGVGNRTTSHLSATYSYQPFNRLTSTSSASYTYDNNGDLISKTEGIPTTQYGWDYENRLKTVTRLASPDVSYKYDALGRRIERTKSVSIPVPVILETTRFVYDGTDVVRDLDGNGATMADYLNGPGIDNKLRQTVGATTSYFLADHLGTTRALTNPSGAVTSSLSYDSFGNVTSGSAPTRYTYSGREIDSDTSLIYYRARWYAPQQGRFISEDPLGLRGGDINLYGYVLNNPVNFRDPTGTQRADRDRPGDIEWARGLKKAIDQMPTSKGSCECRSASSVLLLAGGLAVADGPQPGITDVIAIAYLVTALSATLSPRVECPPRDRVIPFPRDTGARNRWTCTARCNLENFSNVPNAPARVEANGSGPTESLACQAAKDAAQAMSPLGTYSRHCQCVRCWKN